jgi:ubiquitin-protein ligase
MTTDIATRRLTKDIAILDKNKAELQSRGIYIHVDEANIHNLRVLIVPKEKRDGDLISPYTAGFFMFHLTFPGDFPMSPPNVTFYPQQNHCRLHPNFYQIGKVCLSVINTWGANDWSPATSVLNLVNILEARFTERSLCFEPGLEMASPEQIQAFNMTVEYAKYTCILEALDHPVFEPFRAIIREEFKQNEAYLIRRLEEMKALNGDKYQVKTFYDRITCDYGKMLKNMQRKN